MKKNKMKIGIQAHSRGIRIHLLVVFIQMIFTGFVLADNRWVCYDCEQDMNPNYPTISNAISAANSGDTIYIHAEQDPNNPNQILQYSEHVVVDKPLTITSLSEHIDYGWPVIKLDDFNIYNEVVEIPASGAGSEISNLDIHGPVNNNTGCATDPIDCMDQKVGIRIEADDCFIDNCRITFCMTGIYVESTGNIISDCHVGDRWWVKPVSGPYCYKEYWSDVFGGTSIAYPGNGFGIVQVEPTWAQQPNELSLDRPITEIIDCTIRSNRYYGLVLTNGSRAHVAHNIIAWNGDQGVTISQSIPDKTGGLLSLFTEVQILANDNKLQAPTILSNTIYGNKGYQIGIFTESALHSHIYNSPIIMSNNIGIEDDMPYPPGSYSEYEYLICCGPTPNQTATPTPLPGIPTSLPGPGVFAYDYHGSGPILDACVKSLSL